MNTINDVKETVTSFFAGNPFSTVVGQKIDEATSADLASEDWALNMQICDLVNSSEEATKDAIRAIKKKLMLNVGKNYKTTLFTLTILETCVKNCGKRFHMLVCNKDFIHDLIKMIGPKNDPPTFVQEKILNLVQIWSETFQNDPDLQGVVQVYKELKMKGIEFPAYDSVQARVSDGSSCPVEAPVIPPEQIAKLHSELDVVRNNMKVFNEMLLELKPGQEHPSDMELLRDLCCTCQAMQKRILILLEKVNNAELTEELLHINDDLNNLLLRYERYQRSQQVKELQNATTSDFMTFTDANTVEGDNKEAGIDSQIPSESKKTESNVDASKDGLKNSSYPILEQNFEEGVTSSEFDRFLEERAAQMGPTNAPSRSVPKDNPASEGN